MSTIEATFDGNVFRPTQPVALLPDTPVRLTVEVVSRTTNSPRSFLNTAKSLELQGPPDWASNLDSYLYGEETGSGS